MHNKIRINYVITILSYAELPDKVSISMGDHTGPMFEGIHYELLCDVQNVAPVHLLTVNWYKDDDLVESQNMTSHFKKIPVNQSFSLQIFPRETDSGSLYMCKVVLNLEQQRPDDNLIVTSEPFNVTVGELFNAIL